MLILEVCVCVCVFQTEGATLTAHLTAGLPGLQEWGDQATGVQVILGTTEEEALIFTAPSVNLHNLN